MSIVNFTYKRTQKSIGGFEIDAFISEKYSFSNSVTELPVEDGSNVNDNVVSGATAISIEAFIGMAKFETINGDSVEYEAWEGDIPETAAELPQEDPKARIIQAYYELKRLKEEKQPLTVELGLDTFPNMVITSFEIDRNVQNGADLPFSMSFKEVRIVKSETTTVNSSRGGGDQTAGITSGGTQATKKVDPESGMMQEEWKKALNKNRCTYDEYLEVCQKNRWTP